jgi:Mrp family chromosome partitioning ATPase
VLPAGAGVESLSELLGSREMRATLDRFAEEFDLVILDTPPVLAATAGTAALAAAVDRVVFVVRAGDTSRENARAALEQLQAVGAHLVGGVLNGYRAASESAAHA